jgi:hypothetical protein
MLTNLLLGPIALVLYFLGAPKFLTATFALLAVASGAWFAFTLPHAFYLGLLPVAMGGFVFYKLLRSRLVV